MHEHYRHANAVDSKYSKHQFIFKKVNNIKAKRGVSYFLIEY